MYTDSENEQEKEEQLFEYFFALPMEIRLFIVEKLNIRDRFRFARCCQGSWNIWARITKNKPCSIVVKAIQNRVKLTITHNENEEYPGRKVGFNLLFEEGQDNKQFIRYDNLRNREIWKIEVDNSFDVFQIAADHVKKAVQFYQNSVTDIFINAKDLVDKLSFEEESIENLRSLESLVVYKNIDNLRSLLSKTRHPLRKLAAYYIENGSTLENCEQVFHVHGKLIWHHTIFNYETFLQLSAKKVKIRIGALTEQDICSFIKSWINKSYQGPIKQVRWMLVDTKFDVGLLWKLLGKDSNLLSDDIVMERDLEMADVSHALRVLTFPGFHVLGESEDSDSGSDSDYEPGVVENEEEDYNYDYEAAFFDNFIDYGGEDLEDLEDLEGFEDSENEESEDEDEG